MKVLIHFGPSVLIWSADNKFSSVNVDLPLDYIDRFVVLLYSPFTVERMSYTIYDTRKKNNVFHIPSQCSAEVNRLCTLTLSYMC